MKGKTVYIKLQSGRNHSDTTLSFQTLSLLQNDFAIRRSLYNKAITWLLAIPCSLFRSFLFSAYTFCISESVYTKRRLHLQKLAITKYCDVYITRDSAVHPSTYLFNDTTQCNMLFVAIYYSYHVFLIFLRDSSLQAAPPIGKEILKK